jgi:hypothetical protein
VVVEEPLGPRIRRLQLPSHVGKAHAAQFP